MNGGRQSIPCLALHLQLVAACISQHQPWLFHMMASLTWAARSGDHRGAVSPYASLHTQALA
jgi:hypothetical protein